jgi:hypothetical protein
MRKIVQDDGTVMFEVMGQLLTEQEFDAQFTPRPRAGDSFVAWKPLASDALAVHPNQVKQATEDAKKKGVAVEFMPDGRPVFTSREQRKRYCQMYGFFDKAAGYGDAAAGSCKRDVPDRPDGRPEVAILHHLGRQLGRGR